MPVQVVDLFCGVGGLTHGLINSGLNVTDGFDIDGTCKYSYEHNNTSDFHQENIREMTGNEIIECYNPDVVRVLVGCAPCQPFSQMRFKMGNGNQEDEKYNLLTEFSRMIEAVHPTVVSMENVPQIRDTNIYKEFLETLENLGYSISANVVFCPDYGISQTRRRFVLLASLLGDIKLIEPTHKNEHITIRDVIEDLTEISAGEFDPNDPLHRAARLSEKNIQRIQASIPGGTWLDWPEELRCNCHKKDSGKTYSSVYGRLSWDQIGPTITTQFYAYGTGRHGHPEQDRGLSLREGALLQTFPVDYDFIDPEVPFCFRDIARHIGNAVPVRLGEIIGQSIIEHLNNNNIEV
ncbi:MAG: DNA cytosine methyltransferase [Eubacterium sp.]|nr:DNA cytosine methyltransferase [Eubacterium sp.]